MNDRRANEPNHTSHGDQRPAGRLSPWAIAALLFSLAVFCPLMILLAPLLAIKALADIRTRPGVTGTFMAVTAMVIGLLATLLWGGGAWWWHGAVRAPLLEGPRQPLMQGQLGEIETFQSAFHGRGATIDPAVAQAFLTEMTGRYGVLRDLVQDRFSTEGQTAAPGRLSAIVPYVLQFETSMIRAEAEFVLLESGFEFHDPRSWGVAAKWRSIVILDDALGDLAYPPDATRQRMDEDTAAETDQSDGQQ